MAVGDVHTDVAVNTSGSYGVFSITNNTGNPVMVTSIATDGGIDGNATMAANGDSVGAELIDVTFKNDQGRDNSVKSHYERASIPLGDGDSLEFAGDNNTSIAVTYIEIDKNVNVYKGGAGAIPEDSTETLSSIGVSDGEIIRFFESYTGTSLSKNVSGTWRFITSPGSAGFLRLKIEDASQWRLESPYDSSAGYLICTIEP